MNTKKTESEAGILDARQAYGDRVTNMRQQAEMINAYLGGRPVTAVDVPIIFILVKAHRLGNMPDYADNYDDIEGYLQIAREVIGDEMIEAETAALYQLYKSEGTYSAQEQALKDALGGAMPRHPYENVERDAERDAMEAWMKRNTENAPMPRPARHINTRQRGE